MNVAMWGSDVPVSMPVPPTKDRPTLTNLGDGFAMTSGGIAHDIDLTVFEEYRVPSFAPVIPTPEGAQGG